MFAILVVVLLFEVRAASCYIVVGACLVLGFLSIGRAWNKTGTGKQCGEYVGC